MIRCSATLIAAALIAGCSKPSPRQSSENPYGLMAAMEPRSVMELQALEEPPPPNAEMPPPGAVPSPPGQSTEQDKAPVVSLPRIAYTYSYDYRLPLAQIAAVQQRHVAACDALGAARCRVVALERSSGEGRYSSATLSLKVDSRIAKSFGARLGSMVGEAGGETSEQQVTAEDLSKQIVDTEAKVRAKQALADRLMVLLQNRNGRVGELVEAERAFAQAQEELDAARTWLAQMRGRVSQSDIAIRYDSDAPLSGGFWQPVRDAFGSAGQTFGFSLGAAITFTLAALPWVALLTLVIWLLRRIGWVRRLRMPWPKRWRQTPPDQGASNAPVGPDAA